MNDEKIILKSLVKEGILNKRQAYDLMCSDSKLELKNIMNSIISLDKTRISNIRATIMASWNNASTDDKIDNFYSIEELAIFNYILDNKGVTTLNKCDKVCKSYYLKKNAIIRLLERGTIKQYKKNNHTFIFINLNKFKEI